MDNSYWTQKAIDCLQKTVKVGQVFVVKDLFQGAEWEKLSVGDRTSYGRYFKNKVKERQIPNVEYVGKRSNNHNEYRKIKENNK